MQLPLENSKMTYSNYKNLVLEMMILRIIKYLVVNILEIDIIEKVVMK